MSEEIVAEGQVDKSSFRYLLSNYLDRANYFELAKNNRCNEPKDFIIDSLIKEINEEEELRDRLETINKQEDNIYTRYLELAYSARTIVDVIKYISPDKDGKFIKQCKNLHIALKKATACIKDDLRVKDVDD